MIPELHLSKQHLQHIRQNLLILLVLALTSGCSKPDISALIKPKPVYPEHLVPKILAVWPHDPGSFTEGLIYKDGFLYESSGLYGQSNIRKVDPHTGQVLQSTDDPTQIFGEGLALDGDRLFQLTWREKTGYIYDLNNFDRLGSFSYTGEGWGLCFDGDHFFMSNGTSLITIRDPQTFAIVGSLQILQSGTPVKMLNELECVGDSLYANVWMTDTILRIDKSSGELTAVIDASGLLTPDERAQAGPNGVLNGIAYDPADDVFLITGKLWPKLFEVDFVPKTGQ
jgi:glutaminyl-peptide cyclotransferase